MTKNLAFLADYAERRRSPGLAPKEPEQSQAEAPPRLPTPEEREPFFPSLKTRAKMTPWSFLTGSLTLLINWRWWLGLPAKIVQQAVPPIPLVSVLVPAHNEAERIAQTIETVLAQPNLRNVIVINDGSKDDTGKIADVYAKRYPGKVTVVHRAKPSGHKAGALNAGLGSDILKAECIAVIDGDTILHPDAFARMLPHFYDPRVGGVGARVVAGTLLDEEVNFSYRAKDGENTVAHLVAKPAQDHVGALLVSAGCCSIFRKEVFEKIGGFKEGTSAEDMELSWRASIICKLAYEPSAICYSAEPPTLGVYVRQRVRWITGFLQCYKMHVLEGTMRKQNFRVWSMANHVFIMGIMGLPILFLLMITGSHTVLATMLQSVGIEPDEVKIWLLAVASPFVLNLLTLTVMLFLGAHAVAKQERQKVDVSRTLKNILPTFAGNFIVQAVFWYCCWKVFFSATQSTAWGSGNKRG